MAIPAYLGQQLQPSDDRSAERRVLRLEVVATTGPTARSEVVLHDLSLTGFLVEAAEPLNLGDRLEVELPNAGPVGAEVVWGSGRFSGCRFDHPISPAAVSAALLRSPAPADSPAPAPADVRNLQARVEKLANELTKTPETVEAAPAAPVAPAAVPKPAEDEALPLPTRLRIIFGLAFLSWALVAGTAWLF